MHLTYEYGEFDTGGNVDVTKNAGNIAKQTITFNGLANPFVQSYKYDSLDRITEAKETVNGGQTWIQTFGYDRYGNRTSHAETVGSQAKAINEVTLPAVDVNTNKFSNTTDYEFDAVGNLIRDIHGRQFTFNGDNKQVEVRNSANQVVGEYKYDGLGKRIKKEAATEYVVFVYDGLGKLIGEYSADGPPAAPTVNYTATDPLGSPRVLTNKQGEVVSRRDFMPFGEEIVAMAETHRTPGDRYGVGDGVRQKFTGYERDEETGLDFAEARYYYNNHGRFTAVDPLLASGKSADPQTFNRYAYTMNRPLILTDPTGMIAVTGDFYDREGNWLGTDEVGDKKIYLLGPGQVPNKKKPNVNWGGKLDAQTVAELKAASIEVKGLIIYDRNEEGSDYTSGTFKTVGGGEKDVQGVMLEPAGPDTTERNQDKRVKAGLFDLSDHSGKKHKNTFVISNEFVPKDRAILFHRGYDGGWTEGCIMPGGSVKEGRIKAGTSESKTKELKAFIKERGASNVKFIIRNRISN